MAYFVLKNVFKQASIFALISSLVTGDGSYGSKTYNYSACILVDDREYIFYNFLVLFTHYVLFV